MAKPNANSVFEKCLNFLDEQLVKLDQDGQDDVCSRLVDELEIKLGEDFAELEDDDDDDYEEEDDE